MGRENTPSCLKIVNSSECFEFTVKRCKGMKNEWKNKTMRSLFCVCIIHRLYLKMLFSMISIVNSDE